MQIERQAAAGQGSFGIMGGIRSRKNVCHIKLKVVKTGVLLLFSVKSIIQKNYFINFSLIIFSQSGEAK